MKTVQLTVAAALAAVVSIAFAEQAPHLGKVLQEGRAQRGKPAQFAPLPRDAWRFEHGEYQSRHSGVTIRLPQFADEKAVSVREVELRSPEGELGGWQLVFVPNAAGNSMERYGPVSALVVRPLGESAAKDPQAVLKSLEPRSEKDRKKLEVRGYEFRRVSTPAGEAFETVTPNRFVDAAFPQRAHVDEHAEQVKAIGVTRDIVKNDALLEFSQVFPCRGLNPEACKTAARKAADAFVADLVSFTLPKPGKK